MLLGAGLNLAIRSTDVIQMADQEILSWFARARTPALTGPAKALTLLTIFATVMGLRVATVVGDDGRFVGVVTIDGIAGGLDQ